MYRGASCDDRGRIERARTADQTAASADPVDHGSGRAENPPSEPVRGRHHRVFWVTPYNGQQTADLLQIRKPYRPALHVDGKREAQARPRADRIAQQGQKIPCQRFFCKAIKAEPAASTRTRGLTEAA